ncbi:hypothetical protein GH714_040148 [Hevea brasiliensis]|uniref:ENTH domain-containing protein n=1 Tax=Hevea brasiliensis TaxID=3981 RepID=A0A6A6LMH3_HEVBR|nr:hypothetical protein GH714_040148 [Hevea brasiliensis]
MAPSKIRRALGAVKDQTSIGLAKVGSSNSLSDLDVAIVKATRHEEYPAEERHVREILSLTSYSRAYVSACVNTLSRRLNKTKNWTVALKTLVLIQRLLAEGDPAYEQEIFFATRRGTRLLNMSDFRDASRSNSWDYSAFVRTYALYLDERLEFRMQGRRGRRSAFGIDDGEDEGGAKHTRVVMVALYPVVKESFQIYYDIAEILGILIDRFMELEIPDSIKVYDIFCRVSKQFDELDNFYGWCKTVGISRSSEYPEVEKITHKKLDLMDEFIRDKSALAQSKQAITYEPNVETKEEESKEPDENEVDMNAIKALPPPEDFTEAPAQEVQQEPIKEEEKQEILEKEADLLNLGDDALSTEAYGNQLALALFDGDGGASTGSAATTPALEAFSDDTADWETALVQSASNFSNKRTSLAGGFDMMLLDGMYQQGATNAAISTLANAASGSASSVALGSAGRPAMLALPAPPTADNSSTTLPNADPFAASLAVAHHHMCKCQTWRRSRSF